MLTAPQQQNSRRRRWMTTPLGSTATMMSGPLGHVRMGVVGMALLVCITVVGFLTGRWHVVIDRQQRTTVVTQGTHETSHAAVASSLLSSMPSAALTFQTNAASTIHPAVLGSEAQQASATANVIAAEDVPDDQWPLREIESAAEFTRYGLHEGTSVRCVSRGMQQKCVFRNLVVHRNRFLVYHPLPLQHDTAVNPAAASRDHWPNLDLIAHASFPNPIVPPDGQQAPLWQNHRYRGHAIETAAPTTQHYGDICKRVVVSATGKRKEGEAREREEGEAAATVAVMFVFRMSGHSTYHLWENNLGPFYATIQDTFDFPPEGPEAKRLRDMMNDPSRLIISFVDRKPRHGPKAPKLLDQLLRLFTHTPLLNATQISAPTCIPLAVVGWSSSRFPHREVIREVKRRWGIAPSPQRLPPKPTKVIYISRNHPSVTRGRKMINEAEVYPVLNRTVFDWIGVPVEKVFMEDLSFREQVQLASSTHLMFSPHGGGVANCIWMPPGSVVVEFVAPVGKTLPGMYHTMCSNSGVKHFHFLADGDPRDASIRDNARLFSNLIMPVDRLLQNAKKALELFSKSRDQRT